MRSLLKLDRTYSVMDKTSFDWASLMRRFVLLTVDVALMVLATLAAFILRENFDVPESRFLEFFPYLPAVGAGAAATFALAGLHRAVWRFSSLPDYLRVTSAVAATVFASAALSFAYNRLDGVPRSASCLAIPGGHSLPDGGQGIAPARSCGKGPP